MEQRISPTSPKKFPERSNPEPSSQKERIQKASPFGWLNLTLLVLISIICGAIAAFLMITQIDRFGISWYQQFEKISAILTSRTNSREYAIQEQEKSSFIDKFKPSMFEIFAQTQQTTRASGLQILPSNLFVGFGIFVTVDGYAIAPSSVFNDAKDTIVARDANGKIQNISSITKDPVSGLAFFKLQNTAGSVVDIADPQEIFPISPVSVLYKFPAYASYSLDSRETYRMIVSSQQADNSYIMSSEDFFSHIAIKSITEYPKGSLIIRGDGVVLGMFDGNTANPAIIYLPERKQVLNQFFSDKKIAYPRLGIQGIDLATTPMLNRGIAEKNSAGFLILSSADGKQPGITAKSPAFKAGLLESDIIIQINKIPISGTITLSQALLTANPGSTITVRLVRGGTEMDVTVTLDSL